MRMIIITLTNNVKMMMIVCNIDDHEREVLRNESEGYNVVSEGNSENVDKVGNDDDDIDSEDEHSG